MGFLVTNSVQASAGFDILWEADSYVPSFFQGLPLPSVGSEIKVVIMPNLYTAGQPLDPLKVNYRWEKNGKLLADSSGVGKQKLTFIAEKENNIRITASTPNELTKITETLSIKAVEPRINFYPVNAAGETIFKQNVKSPLTLTFREEVVAAWPFYLPSRYTTTEPKFEWFYNDKKIDSDPNEPSVIKLVPPQSTTKENRSLVKLKASDYLSNKSVEKSLEVKF